MIAKLTGVLDSVEEDRAIVDAGGVGYLVFASARTLRALPPPGEAVSLYIETHVREDHIHLYGFSTAREQALFRLLISVSGVGAKGALALLSALAPDALANAIAAEDVAALSQAQGIGRRIAQRIAGELKESVAGMALGPRPAGEAASGGATAAAGATDAEAEALDDAVSALVNLGYGRAEAYTAVASAAAKQEEAVPLAALIRAGLKELAS